MMHANLGQHRTYRRTRPIQTQSADRATTTTAVWLLPITTNSMGVWAYCIVSACAKRGLFSGYAYVTAQQYWVTR